MPVLRTSMPSGLSLEFSGGSRGGPSDVDRRVAKVRPEIPTDAHSECCAEIRYGHSEKIDQGVASKRPNVESERARVPMKGSVGNIGLASEAKLRKTRECTFRNACVCALGRFRHDKDKHPLCVVILWLHRL